MNEENLTQIMDSIQSKIGKDASATIADDLGRLITENDAAIKAAAAQDAKIKELKSRNEKLVAANGSLLQQVSMADEPARATSKKDGNEQQPISWKDCFDERGNFLK